MKRKLLVSVTLICALVLLVGVVQAKPIEQVSDADELGPEVRAEIAAADDSGEMVSVIVTLTDQANLQAIHGNSRSQRHQAVVETLQATAASGQRNIRGILESGRAQGRVSDVTYFWIFNGMAVTASPEVIEELAAHDDVLSISLDSQIKAPIVPEAVNTPESNLSTINAPALWDMGYRGQGIVIASMDTGVDRSHPDLSSQWRGGKNSWYDPYGQHRRPADVNGHGTWTMGVMVGQDNGGTAIGVAPDAQWIAVKIFDDSGYATSTAIHLGYQWLLDPDGRSQTDDAPHVVNNSWTYDSPGCSLEFEPDIQALLAAGIFPVFSAGNGGPYAETSYSPANNPSAFAVGATNDNDIIYTYSSRGPSACGESQNIFPELVAPGVTIRTSNPGGSYTSPTGTSLASPHVAGALALLLSADPTLTVAEQEAALINSAVDLGVSGIDNTYGYGRLDILAAYEWLFGTGTSTPPPTDTPTPEPTQTPTPDPGGAAHVGDLDGSGSIQGKSGKWKATVTITIHDANENPVSGATVSGIWSNGSSGSASCITDSNGQCSVTSSNISNSDSVTFSVEGVVHTTLTYDPSGNHEPDGDSDGTSIVINKPN